MDPRGAAHVGARGLVGSLGLGEVLVGGAVLAQVVGLVEELVQVVGQPGQALGVVANVLEGELGRRRLAVLAVGRVVGRPVAGDAAAHVAAVRGGAGVTGLGRAGGHLVEVAQDLAVVVVGHEGGHGVGEVAAAVAGAGRAVGRLVGVVGRLAAGGRGGIGAVRDVPVGRAVLVGHVVEAGVGQRRVGAAGRLGRPAGDGVQGLEGGGGADGGHGRVGGDGGQLGRGGRHGHDPARLDPHHPHAGTGQPGRQRSGGLVGEGPHQHGPGRRPGQLVEGGRQLEPGLEGNHGPHPGQGPGPLGGDGRAPGDVGGVGHDAQKAHARGRQRVLGHGRHRHLELHQPQGRGGVGHIEGGGNRRRARRGVEAGPGQADALPEGVRRACGNGTGDAGPGGRQAPHREQGQGHPGHDRPPQPHGITSSRLGPARGRCPNPGSTSRFDGAHPPPSLPARRGTRARPSAQGGPQAGEGLGRPVQALLTGHDGVEAVDPHVPQLADPLGHLVG